MTVVTLKDNYICCDELCIKCPHVAIENVIQDFKFNIRGNFNLLEIKVGLKLISLITKNVVLDKSLEDLLYVVKQEADIRIFFKEGNKKINHTLEEKSEAVEVILATLLLDISFRSSIKEYLIESINEL